MNRCCDLLEVNHVALGKHAATAGDPRRVLRPERKLTKLALDGHADPACLLVKERARAGRADTVHREVMQPGTSIAAFHRKQFGVFAAHLDHRLNAGQESRNRACLGYDFIDEETADKLSCKLPTATGGRNPGKLLSHRKGFKNLQQHVKRSAVAVIIAILDYLQVVVDEDGVD